jgi:hypothetical protein
MWNDFISVTYFGWNAFISITVENHNLCIKQEGSQFEQICFKLNT